MVSNLITIKVKPVDKEIMCRFGKEEFKEKNPNTERVTIPELFNFFLVERYGFNYAVLKSKIENDYHSKPNK